MTLYLLLAGIVCLAVAYDGMRGAGLALLGCAVLNELWRRWRRPSRRIIRRDELPRFKE